MVCELLVYKTSFSLDELRCHFPAFASDGGANDLEYVIYKNEMFGKFLKQIIALNCANNSSHQACMGTLVSTTGMQLNTHVYIYISSKTV